MKLRLLLPLAMVVGGCAADIKVPAQPGVSLIAEFDPLASPAPRIPLPNDLAKTGGDGVHLNVPDSPTDAPAQVDFNHYLNTLDGFPSSTPGSFSFSGAIDPATLSAGSPTVNGSVLVLDATGMQPLGPDDYKLTLSADGTSVSITPTRRWASGSQYVVVVFGGDDETGVKGAAGEKVLASPAFFFLRSPKPVLGVCGDGNSVGCACPAQVVAKADPKDPTCHSVIIGLGDALARQLEGGREQLSAALDQLLPFSGSDHNGPRKRENVALMWNFTIASAPMAVFDPTRGDVPFPNDVLINQTTKLVNVPFAASDPQAAIKMGLNGLDGFSTTGPETLGIDFADEIDAATVTQASAIMLSLTSGAPEYDAAPVYVNSGMTFAGQIALQPTSALDSDQAQYAAVVTTDVKDKMGRALVPPPVMVLVRGTHPLVDAMGHTTVPSALDDASAQQLEVLRQAEAPLFDALQMLLGLPREKVAAAWTFTTESIMRPLNALDEMPTVAGITTDATILHVATTADITAKAGQLAFPSTHLGAIVTGSMTTERAADPVTGIIPFDRTTLDGTGRFSVHLSATAVTEPVRFILTLPKTGGPWPVAIVQHGFTTWRGAMMPLADGFAAAGWATVMIDLPYHGGRAVCTDDTQCVSAAAGSCSKTTGQCAGGFKFAVASTSDPLACALQPLTNDPTDCRPLASGAAFVNPGNLFASRDNVRQFVVDAAQLIRVLQDQSNGAGLYHQLIPLSLAGYDATKLGYLGQSLGGIAGAIFLSVAPQPQVGVLNVTGGHLFDIIAYGSFSNLLQPLLTALGIMPDTAAYLQLAATARWILDPADPFAVGKHLVRNPSVSYLSGAKNAAKLLIQQEDGMDTVIPARFHEQLAGEIFGPAGLDGAGHTQGHTTGGATVSTYFPTAVHGTVIDPLPSAALMQSEQNQAITWISSSGATIPSP